MMAEPHPFPEAMEVEYDSDATEPISTPEGDVEDEGEEEDGEDSRASPIQELINVDLESPQIRRRRRTSTAALQYLDSGEESQVEDTGSPEIGRRRPTPLPDANPDEEEEEEEVVHVLPPPETSGAVVPPQLQESEPLPSSPELFDNTPPSPSPPPVPPLVPPDDSSGPHQSPQPLPSQHHQVRGSVSPSEGAGSSVEASATRPPEVLNPPAVAGPSTSVTTSSSTPKRKHKDKAPVQGSPESDDEGQTCPICFEAWSNMGDHRLSSLKCGHLFGFVCINKWLQGTNRQKGRCPQCNAKATKKDIRVIYAKSIKVLDTTEKERILKELEKEREEKRRLEVEHAQTKLKYELKNQLVVKLQEELKVLKASTSGAGMLSKSSSKGEESGNTKNRLVYSNWLEVCREGGCRVMAHNEWLGMLVVSMPSQVGMFPGYGVKKINLLELRVDRYVPLHQKEIRDLAFNPAKHDLLLSVGMDRLVKITNICSNASVVQFSAPSPLWCCCWSTTESNVFYVGTTTGRLQQYDTRNTTGPVATIDLPGTGPAVSMTYIHPGPESSLTWGGLLVARLKSCFFVEAGMPGEAKSHLLPLDGSFTSVSCEADTCHVLVSSRPTLQHLHARHAVCLLQQLNATPEAGEGARRTVTAQPVHTFQGGTTTNVLTRSLLARPPYPGSCPLVYASDESTQSIYVWDLNTMSCLQQLRHSDTVVDLLQLPLGQTPHLAALTQKGVRLYRWSNQQS